VAAEIVLVRHGETEWSANGRHTSATDLPLTSEGRRRARALGPQLSERSFALVLCSPLLRARETCELAGFGEAAVTCEELREWDYGRYEGMTRDEILREDPSWDLWRAGCPGGETPAQVGARADVVLARLRDAGGDSLAFAHGHVLRVLTACWVGMGPPGGARFLLAAGAIGVLGHEHETKALSQWNMCP